MAPMPAERQTRPSASRFVSTATAACSSVPMSQTIQMGCSPSSPESQQTESRIGQTKLVEPLEGFSPSPYTNGSP